MISKLGTAGQTKDEVKNGLFDQGTQFFTVGANWDFEDNPNGLRHTAGSLETFSQDLANATHTTITYNIKYFTSGLTAGSFVVKAGSGDIAAVTTSTNGWHNFDSVFTTDTVLSFTPTTDFDGKISAIVVRKLKKQP